MKNIVFISEKEQPKADLVLSIIQEGSILGSFLEKINSQTQGGVHYNFKRQTAQDKQLVHMTTNGLSSIDSLYIFKLNNSLTAIENGALAAASISQELAYHKSLVVDATSIDSNALISGFLLGFLLRVWKPCKSECTLYILSCHPKQAEEAFNNDNILYESVAFARKLTTEAANLMPPQEFVKRCLELQQHGLVVRVIDAEQLQSLGMQGIYHVGKGSVNPPKLLILEWNGAEKNTPFIGLAGKGVCFDSGGINLKNQYLLQMKWDKAGGGIVAGVLMNAARKKLKCNIVGAIGLVENMPDGAALKPGDILSMCNGKTVEVIDTDFEGRLVLADCMWYLQDRYSIQTLFDFGTLTPESFGALADAYAGLYCENDTLRNALVKAGETSQECLWHLPMGECFAKQLTSECADLRNCGIPGFGECGAAAEFLKHFVKPEVNWAHIDIAGVAWNNGDSLYNCKGVSGFGVRLMDALLSTN